MEKSKGTALSRMHNGKKIKTKKYSPPQIKKLNPVRVADALRFRLQSGEPPSVPGPAGQSPSVPAATVF